MKKTPVTAVLGLLAVLAATPTLADEPIDCFYEANQSHALCQANVAAPTPAVMFAEPEYLVLQSADDEPIDCFYDANRMQAVCQAAPEMIVMHGAAE